jgi:putative transcriptional regulator
MMSKTAHDAIMAGLEDARAFLEGDRTRGRVHRVYVPDTNVAKVRKSLGLSQGRFAAAFGVNVGTIRNWEQGIRRPEGPARVLLRVIERNPQAVLNAITPRRRSA